MVGTEFVIRPGKHEDLPLTFALAERGLHAVGQRMGVLAAGPPPTEADIRTHWGTERSLFEFLASLPGGSYWVAEGRTRIVAFARVARVGGVDNLTELFVDDEYQGRGLGRQLLRKCWNDSASVVPRIIVAAGAPADLTTYTGVGTAPVAGHWNVVQRAVTYRERRAREEPPLMRTQPLDPKRALREWERPEPLALGHARPELHRHFRSRVCVAGSDERSADVNAVCWLGADGAIGPGVATTPDALVHLVVAILDGEAAAGRELLQLFVPTVNTTLLFRLRALGFQVRWPSWIMSSFPLPGLDRYLPTWPAWIL